MPLVRGSDLPGNLRREILARYVYRWTVENPNRAEAYGRCPVCRVPGGRPESEEIDCRKYHPTIPLETDTAWLASHAFAVNMDGRLSRRQTYAYPAYLAG